MANGTPSRARSRTWPLAWIRSSRPSPSKSARARPNPRTVAGRRRQAERGRGVDERPRPAARKATVERPRKLVDDQVGPAVAVEVAERDAHPGEGLALAVERDARRARPTSSNRRPPRFSNSQQGGAVVGDEDVGPGVAGQVGDEDAQPPAVGQVDPGRPSRRR